MNYTTRQIAALRRERKQRRRYADAGPEMVRLLKIARRVFHFGCEADDIDAVLKAVQPKKETR